MIAALRLSLWPHFLASYISREWIPPDSFVREFPIITTILSIVISISLASILWSYKLTRRITGRIVILHSAVSLVLAYLALLFSQEACIMALSGQSRSVYFWLYLYLCACVAASSEAAVFIRKVFKLGTTVDVAQRFGLVVSILGILGSFGCFLRGYHNINTNSPSYYVTLFATLWISFGIVLMCVSFEGMGRILKIDFLRKLAKIPPSILAWFIRRLYEFIAKYFQIIIGLVLVAVSAVILRFLYAHSASINGILLGILFLFAMTMLLIGLELIGTDLEIPIMRNAFTGPRNLVSRVIYWANIHYRLSAGCFLLLCSYYLLDIRIDFTTVTVTLAAASRTAPVIHYMRIGAGFIFLLLGVELSAKDLGLPYLDQCATFPVSKSFILGKFLVKRWMLFTGILSLYISSLLARYFGLDLILADFNFNEHVYQSWQTWTGCAYGMVVLIEMNVVMFLVLFGIECIFRDALFDIPFHPLSKTIEFVVIPAVKYLVKRRLSVCGGVCLGFAAVIVQSQSQSKIEFLIYVSVSTSASVAISLALAFVLALALTGLELIGRDFDIPYLRSSLSGPIKGLMRTISWVFNEIIIRVCKFCFIDHLLFTIGVVLISPNIVLVAAGYGFSLTLATLIPVAVGIELIGRDIDVEMMFIVSKTWKGVVWVVKNIVMPMLRKVKNGGSMIYTSLNAYRVWIVENIVVPVFRYVWRKVKNGSIMIFTPINAHRKFVIGLFMCISSASVSSYHLNLKYHEYDHVITMEGTVPLYVAVYVGMTIRVLTFLIGVELIARDLGIPILKSLVSTPTKLIARYIVKPVVLHGWKFVSVVICAQMSALFFHNAYVTFSAGGFSLIVVVFAFAGYGSFSITIAILGYASSIRRINSLANLLLGNNDLFIVQILTLVYRLVAMILTVVIRFVAFIIRRFHTFIMRLTDIVSIVFKFVWKYSLRLILKLLLSILRIIWTNSILAFSTAVLVLFLLYGVHSGLIGDGGFGEYIDGFVYVHAQIRHHWIPEAVTFMSQHVLKSKAYLFDLLKSILKSRLFSTITTLSHSANGQFRSLGGLLMNSTIVSVYSLCESPVFAAVFYTLSVITTRRGFASHKSFSVSLLLLGIGLHLYRNLAFYLSIVAAIYLICAWAFMLQERRSVHRELSSADSHGYRHSVLYDDDDDESNEKEKGKKRSRIRVVTYHTETETSKWPAHNSDCSICLEVFVEGDEENRVRVAILPCLHAYHVECVREWVEERKDRATCPLCRAPLATADSRFGHALEFAFG